MDHAGNPPRVAPRQVLADHVYESIMVSLVDGRLPADSALNIDALARELQISQTPIREALARLESTGLVRRTALKGYRVAPVFSAEELGQLMEARLVIEPANAFFACERSTPQFADELEALVGAMASAPTGPAEFQPYLEADERFHRAIAQRAENPFLLSAYSALGGQVQRFRLFGGLGVTDAEFAIAEHSAIHEAFQLGDAELARDRMSSHLLGVQARAQSDREHLDE